jgi:hypothetical protein
MIEKIKELVNAKPKHFHLIVAKDPAMKQWVMENSLIESDRMIEHIYSAVNGITNKCQNGNTKKYVRWSDGFGGCGPASSCKCTRDSIANGVILTKSKTSQESINDSNKKREETMLKKYGAKFNSQRAEVKPSISKPKISNDAHILLSDPEWLKAEYVEKQRSLVDIAEELNVFYGTVGEYCAKHGFEIRRRSNYSLEEMQIANYIKSLGFDAVESDYSVLGSHEIDIFVPSKQFGVEVNGLIWHSYHPTLINKAGKEENKNRHLDKTSKAASNGVNLFHVTDLEWSDKQEIIKSMIASKLGVTERLHARKCSLSALTQSQAKSFFDGNHVQGHVNSAIYLGLFFGDELVMAISAGKNRFKNDGKIELHRMCSKKFTTVVGGASRLIKSLRILADTSITTYCDRAKSDGMGYAAIGFKLVGHSEPGYFWTNGHSVISRYKAQKSQLKKWLSSFDPSKTESQNMFDAGYRRYHDCGNFIFEYE